MKDSNDKDNMSPASQVAFLIKRIYRDGLTTTSGGNISVRDDKGDIWITPSAVDKGTLQPSDIICVHPDGKADGPHKPSSEYPFHQAIYKCRPDITAIIHAHPPALVSFSIARQMPDTRAIAGARIICGETGYAGYELPGSEALGKKIREQFGKGLNSVIMENHGAVAGGTGLPDAYRRFESLEYCARTILSGRILGTIHSLTDEQIGAFENQLPILYPETERVLCSPEEAEKRSALCGIVKRGRRQGLLTAAGIASVRTQGNGFLVTPESQSPWDPEPGDMVRVAEGKREPGGIPSRSSWLHQRIYRENPGIHAIIQAQPTCLMAFGITRTRMNVRTIPESWIFLQDLPTLSFDDLSPATTVIPRHFTSGTPGLIIGNDSVIFTGDTLLQAFDRLEIAEFSAKSILMGAPLGKMTPISDEQVEELRKAFLGK